jgi:UDP-N-acetylmuramate dehydrogenase
MEIYQNQPLAPYTTVKIGGPADTLIITHTTAEFIETLKKLDEESKFKRGRSEANAEGLSTANFDSSQVTILGNGSNVLISDSGIRGTVIKNMANSIEYLPNNQVKVDSGVQLQVLINNTINHSLSGLEEFAYIPSTVGGAISGNIHSDNKTNFNKFVVKTETFDFNNQPIILWATLQLSAGDPVASKQIVTDIIAKKTKVQSMNSLGSVFKNPENDTAGRIIDQELHLKGFQIGNAQISPLHANFILNLGHATAADYLSIIKKIQSEAKAKGFILEPEIKFLGDFS